MPHCKSCQAEAEPEAVYCASCGAQMRYTTFHDALRGSPTSFQLLWCGLVVLITVVSFVMFPIAGVIVGGLLIRKTWSALTDPTPLPKLRG